jgi:hypothetical protein
VVLLRLELLHFCRKRIEQAKCHRAQELMRKKF